MLELGEIISRLCLSVSQIGRGIVEQCGYINSEKAFMVFCSPWIHEIFFSSNFSIVVVLSFWRISEKQGYKKVDFSLRKLSLRYHKKNINKSSTFWL